MQYAKERTYLYLTDIQDSTFEKYNDLMKYKDKDYVKDQLENNPRYYYRPYKLIHDVEKKANQTKDEIAHFSAVKQSQLKSLDALYAELTNPEFNKYEAVFWLTKVANSGHVKAMTLLGQCYHLMIGVTEKLNFNYDRKAKIWLKKAADLNDQEAIDYLKNFKL